jgi:hypothetical protein
VILFYLYSLPQLSSLTIILEEDSYYNLDDMYRLIFRFPYLKYNKVSILEPEESTIFVPMSINAKPSTITRLVISFGCTLNELTSLILHTPHLQYLSCEDLLETDEDEVNRNKEQLMLADLTRISISNCSIDFDQFEIFITKISFQLRKLCLSKVQLIQKSTKFFFFDFFTWFDRARRALQNCIYLKISDPFLVIKK